MLLYKYRCNSHNKNQVKAPTDEVAALIIAVRIFSDFCSKQNIYFDRKNVFLSHKLREGEYVYGFEMKPGAKPILETISVTKLTFSLT